jgi:hypothetical protein
VFLNKKKSVFFLPTQTEKTKMKNNLLFDLTGSHKPKADLGPTREAEKPTPVSRIEFETNHVVIGTKEPAEGRYNTLSRLTYKHGQGDERASVESAVKLKADARQRALANQTRNFALPLDDKKKPQLMSEVHQAQQTSQAILNTFQRRHKRGEAGVFEPEDSPLRGRSVSPLLRSLASANNNNNTRSLLNNTSSSSNNSPGQLRNTSNNNNSSTAVAASIVINPRVERVYKKDEVLANIQQASDMREHMIRMNATSIVEGAGTDQRSEQRKERMEALQSTHRSSFQPRDSAHAAAERKQQATELKKLQTKSSATPIEDVPTRWASEVRSNFATKVTPAPPPLCTTAQKQHLKLDDAEGRELLRTGESLKSLYRADLKNFGKEGQAATPVISWHRHQISLGSDDRKTAPSLYRASFTPTVFVDKSRGGAK